VTIPFGLPCYGLVMSFFFATLNRLFTKSLITFLFSLPALLWLHPDNIAPVPVRFVEGTLHGFLVLSTTDGTMIASSEETVVFTQQKVFSMQSYQSVQRGPAFAEDKEILLDRSSGKYRVKTTDHKDGKDKVSEGSLDLPADVYNGMVFTVAKNRPRAASKTIQLVAFTPEPRIIQLAIAPVGEQKSHGGRAHEDGDTVCAASATRGLVEAFRKINGQDAAGRAMSGFSQTRYQLL
jgi:hypothetical protein